MVHLGNKLTALSNILVSLDHSDTPQEMLNFLMDNCIRITQATSGSVMLIDTQSQVLEIKVARGLRKDAIKNVRLKIGEGVTGRVAQTGKPVLLNDVGNIDYYVRIRSDLKAELAVPLILNQEVIGVLSVDSNHHNAFSDEDLMLLQISASMVVQILKKEKIIDELKRKVAQLTLLLQVAEVLERADRLENNFQKIMEILSSTFPIKRGMLLLLTPENKLTIFQGYRLSEEAIQRGIYEIGEGVLGRVVKTGESVSIRSIIESQDFLNRLQIRRNRREIHSFFAFPIKFNHKIGGVLAVEKAFKGEDDFRVTQETLFLVSSLVANKVENFERAEQEKSALIEENVKLREKLGLKDLSPQFIGKNQKIKDILATAAVVADTDATLLITGETGTGKEVLARYIHFSSRRARNPFVSINCAAIPENLLESELFGYKKGAFTHAVTDKKGKFLLADGGTLFLDEIGDLDMNLQAKLLRILQEKVVEPLGSETGIRINVRIMAATNKDLLSQVKGQKFREDLYYRINVIHFHLPALRERADDIPFLINHFMARYNREYSKKIKSLSPKCLLALMEHDWPGNIRELENFVERSVILSVGDVVDESILPATMIKDRPAPASRLEDLLRSEIKRSVSGNIYKNIFEKIEKYLIDYALIQCSNRQTDAADFLGVHRNTLREKIRQYKLGQD